MGWFGKLFEEKQAAEDPWQKEGGPAFPARGPVEFYCGLSHRDYFAAAALTGLLANPNRHGTPKETAETALRIADAMFEESAVTDKAVS